MLALRRLRLEPATRYSSCVSPAFVVRAVRGLPPLLLFRGRSVSVVAGLAIFLGGSGGLVVVRGKGDLAPQDGAPRGGAARFEARRQGGLRHGPGRRWRGAARPVEERASRRGGARARIVGRGDGLDGGGRGGDVDDGEVGEAAG